MDLIRKSLVPMATIVIGVKIHTNGVSIFEILYPELPKMTPNLGSMVFVLSVLGVLSQYLPFWPMKSLRPPPALLLYILQLPFVLYVTDMLVRIVWMPCLHVIECVCVSVGRYVVVSSTNFVLYDAPRIEEWMREDGFAFARFAFAMVFFVSMIEITGVRKALQRKFEKKKKSSTLISRPVSEAYSRYQDRRSICPNVNNEFNDVYDHLYESPRRFCSFVDPRDLPQVPRTDLLAMRRRQQYFQNMRH